jgi:hypothetical protein
MNDRYEIIQTVSTPLPYQLGNEYVIRDRKTKAYLHSSLVKNHAWWTTNLSSAQVFDTENDALLALMGIVTANAIGATKEALKINIVQRHRVSDIKRFFSRVGEHLFEVFVGAAIICSLAVIVRIIGQFAWGW